MPIDQVNKQISDTEDLPDEQLIRNEQRELIRRAVETLPQKDRQIVQSYYLDGASYDELIRTHGLSYKAISVRLARAKQKLAKRLGHLRTAIFLPPATTLKQIYSGGLTVMKIGTAPKITVGAIGIIALLFIGIGVHQMILPKSEVLTDASPSVQSPTTTFTPRRFTQMDTNNLETENRENQPQISAKEMQEPEDRFAQPDESDAQTEVDTRQPETESETEHTLTTPDALVEHADQLPFESAEDVMNAYVEGFKNVAFDKIHSLLIGTAREQFHGNITTAVTTKKVPKMTEELRQQLEQQIHAAHLKMYSEVEAVNPEYVGDEFHFQLRIPVQHVHEGLLETFRWRWIRNGEQEVQARSPEISELQENVEAFIRMRKENDAWRIYEIQPLN